MKKSPILVITVMAAIAATTGLLTALSETALAVGGGGDSPIGGGPGGGFGDSPGGGGFSPGGGGGFSPGGGGPGGVGCP
jgi:hypothetical protein